MDVLNVFLSADSGHLQSHLREEPNRSLFTHLGLFLMGFKRQQRLPGHVHKYERSSVGFLPFCCILFYIFFYYYLFFLVMKINM